MSRAASVAERIYQQLKDDIFDFQLLPGDRFSESEIATRMNASRTPVREALYRLERDGYVQVHFRSGWQVRPFDFRYFENLYEVRTLLETDAVRFLAAQNDRGARLAELTSVWCVAAGERLSASDDVARLDEDFHFALVSARGNQEMAAIHRDVCERLRIIRRLDFTQPDRIGVTYDEHAHILRLILAGDAVRANVALSAHIELSKNTVRTITLHRIQQAKQLYNLNIRINDG
ncbi:GntR family transcriptional regulator [Thalassolituus sp. LLYu03]|uniref:GntR family transcriptional regulator n=1 Tax=Thalassolituus sp. LLYu03 TaxID=3421656 RepID=UPI003D2BFB51